jgi:hypothetical protein
MDKSVPNGGSAPAGVSIRMGPVTEAMEIDELVTNGKRKARISAAKPVSYFETGSASEEDEKPLVSSLLPAISIYAIQCEIMGAHLLI